MRIFVLASASAAGDAMGMAVLMTARASIQELVRLKCILDIR